MSKKLVALVLAFALVFSTFTAAFAAEALPADAQAAVTLGMLKGDTSAGVTTQYLTTAPTRLQAAILFLRLKGLENQALAYTSAVNFPDANSATQWQGGRNIMAYLKNHPELGWQGDNGNFKANDKMTAQAYYKVMLETLGYKQNTTDVIGDFTYDQTIAFAASKGLTKVAGVTNFTVSDVATATIEALKANVKGSTKTLAASLVEAGIINAQAAIAAGVYTPAPSTLAVESVNYLNLKELTVKFNKAVDKTSAENEANYGPAVDTATLQADGMTVKLVLTAAMNNQEETTVTVKDVKDANGVALAEQYQTKITPFDGTVPVAESVKLVAPNKFEIKFSEPIHTTGTVEIADGLYGITSALANGSDTVTVQLSSSSLDEGSYKVVVAGYKDFAGYKALDKTFTLNYVKDATAPVATIKEATQAYVIIQFNKAVFDKDGNPLTADYFYHTFTAYKPVAVQTTDNKTFKIIFNDNDPATVGINRPLPEGNVTVVVDYDSNDSKITDEWGNTMTGNAVLTATVTADKTAPTVTKVEAGDAQNKVDVFFSEEVVATAANFTVKDKDGKAVEVSTANLMQDENDNWYVELGFASDLSGAYTIEIKDVTDVAFQPNTIAKVTVSTTIKDITPINTAEVVAAGVDGSSEDYIYVTFPEDMATTGAYSVLNKSAYLVDGVKLGTNDKIETFGSNSKVRIVLADETAYNFANGDQLDLTIGRVADAAGNAVDALAFTVANVAEETAPVVEAVNVLDYNKISIVIDKVIPSVTTAGFLTKNTGDVDGQGNDVWNTLATIVSSTVKDGKTTIVATLKSGAQLSTTDTSDADLQLSVVASKTKADYGMYVTAGDFAGVVADKRAPKLVATNAIVAGQAADTIEIAFTEGLAVARAALYAQDLVVTDSTGKVLVAGIDYTTAVSTNKIVVTVTNASGKYTVKSKDAITYITDGSNNAQAFTKAVEVTLQ